MSDLNWEAVREAVRSFPFPRVEGGAWLVNLSDESLYAGVREVVGEFAHSGVMNEELAAQTLQELADRLERMRLDDARTALLRLRSRIA